MPGPSRPVTPPPPPRPVNPPPPTRPARFTAREQLHEAAIDLNAHWDADTCALRRRITDQVRPVMDLVRQLAEHGLDDPIRYRAGDLMHYIPPTGLPERAECWRCFAGVGDHVYDDTCFATVYADADRRVA